MKIAKTENYSKLYKKLPLNIQKKADKQTLLLSQNLRHPSLRVKKEQGFSDVWEGRVDRHYRFVFVMEADTIILLRVGPHDVGLGKK